LDDAEAPAQKDGGRHFATVAKEPNLSSEISQMT